MAKKPYVFDPGSEATKELVRRAFLDRQEKTTASEPTVAPIGPEPLSPSTPV